MKYQQLISEFETKLEALESCNDDILYKTETQITLTEKCITRLRKKVVQKGFISTQEEIHFFKHIKPQIFSKLIYYVKLYTIESKRPRSGSKFQIKYLNNQINRLQAYFNDNLEFCHYYRRGATMLDEQYFVRGKSGLRSPTEPFDFFMDKHFSTCQDSKVATIMAFDRLIVYLQQEIGKLEINTDNIKINPIKQSSKLFWTGTYAAFVEMIYGCQAMGYFNHGNIDTNKVIAALSDFLNIDKGNPSRTYNEMKARKSSRIKFFEDAGQKLLRKMEDEDGLNK